MSTAGHPWLAASLTESLRRLLRQHLDASATGREALQPLAGQVVALRLEPFGRTLYLCATHEELQILTELSNEPDVTLAGNLAAFARSGLASNGAALAASGISLQGDAETARRFQALCQALKIDWAGFLSRFFGNRLADSLLGMVDAGQRWTRASLQTLETDVGEYLREETRWLPDRSEVDALLTEVDTLRADKDRLSARIERLEAAARTSSPAGPPTAKAS